MPIKFPKLSLKRQAPDKLAFKRRPERDWARLFGAWILLVIILFVVTELALLNIKRAEEAQTKEAVASVTTGASEAQIRRVLEAIRIRAATFVAAQATWTPVIDPSL